MAADPTQPFTITIPGLQDIIRIPALESKELKVERIRRWKQQQSAIPEFLSSVPAMLNYLDDAQDALITGLAIARWLAPRLLARALPGLGWALLANDALNLGSAFLGMLLTGPNGKNRLIQTFFNAAAGRAGRIAAAEKFLKHGIHWLPFALQAGQTLKTVTGYGLQLGGVMGAASDTYWTILRGQTQNVRVIGPPAADPLTKIGRLLTQNPIISWMSNVLNDEDWGIVTLARKAASAFLTESPTPNMQPDVTNQFAATPYPQPQVWSESTKAALFEEGFPVSENTPSPFERIKPRITMDDVMKLTFPQGSTQDEKIAAALPPGDKSAALGAMAKDTGDDFFSMYAGPEAVTPLLTAYERLLAIAQHYNIRPPFGVPYPEAASTVVNIPAGQPLDFASNVRWMELEPSGPYPWPHNPRIIPMFPMTQRSDEYQMGTWCKVALRINCEGWRPDLAPYIPTNYLMHFIGGVGRPFSSKFASSLLFAALLVWGNAWRLTPYEDPGASKRPPRQRKCCRLDSKGQATLGGDDTELRSTSIEIPQPFIPPI